MRLLIVTQVVDTEDPILGFFVRWIEEFAKHCEKVTVICLRKGAFSLPKHVEVISLGEGHRIRRTFELCSISFGRRAEYDAVFAHMSPEFVVAAGWLWRLMGKKVGLWYVHKSVTVWLRIAEFFVQHVFTASKESFKLLTSKLRITGHGIDVAFFAPNPSFPRANHVLSVGRLMRSKRHDVAIEVAARAQKPLRIAGEGVELENLKNLAHVRGVEVSFLGGLNQAQLRDEYQRAAALVHTSETGGVDKVVLEALASGLSVETNADMMKGIVSEGREGVVRNHSLVTTVQKILSAYGR